MIKVLVTLFILTGTGFIAGAQVNTDSNGNVGIGTSTPAVKFAVTPSTAPGLSSGLTYITPVVNIAPAPAANHSIVLIESNGTGSSKVAGLTLRNNRSTNFAYNASNYGGDIIGAISFEGFSTNTGVSRIGAYLRSDVESVQANSLSSNFKFITTDPYSGFLAERMIITSAGNVGIGTSNPGIYKLAVNGSAIFTKVQVKATSTPWPDYVFHPKYQLRSLSSLKAYINEYEHLPDVPSTIEVEKDGLDIGSIQAILLRKIEELTLYMLNQDEEIKSLKKQISTLSPGKK